MPGPCRYIDAPPSQDILKAPGLLAVSALAGRDLVLAATDGGSDIAGRNPEAGLGCASDDQGSEMMRSEVCAVAAAVAWAPAHFVVMMDSQCVERWVRGLLGRGPGLRPTPRLVVHRQVKDPQGGWFWGGEGPPY